MISPLIEKNLKRLLEGRKMAVPGIQYLAVDEQKTIFDYAGGNADIQNQQPMRLNTTLMAYSMTKIFTAVAILQLAEKGDLHLDDPIGGYHLDCPYPAAITIRQLITHTSGIPNPIPLRWVHLAETQATFDEKAALARVLQNHPKLSFPPGARYTYSNIGYWLLGRLIEKVAQQTYADYVKNNILARLGLQQSQMDFVIPDPANHAKGYLRKYSMLNLMKGYLTDRNVWGAYEGSWLSVKNHYVNGPSFGGLVGSAQSFSRFLQDLLSERSALLNPTTRALLYARQPNPAGLPGRMTLGWHVGRLQGGTYFFVEGGGGGFHSEMRIYADRQFASILMINSTEFNSNIFLSQLDEVFLQM